MDSGRPVVRRVLRNSSNTLKRKSTLIPPSEKVKLEKILGLTVANNAALDTDPHTGTIAYPAGCVVVLYNPKRNKQNHIFNASRKTITAVAFSRDGRNLVTGESGHQPAVRVWDLDDYTQVSEFQGHKFGINCVAFSPNLKYIVSIGTQHDMVINVWNWKTNSKVASNKVAANVSDVDFSDDGSYFVTVGNRHVKFWYLDASKSRATANETVPLMGRSGILGEQKNNFFCAVASGKGCISNKTFVITHSGLLCEFNEKRLLDKWVELRTSRASAIVVSEKYIYIGCADGIVRVFSCLTLHYIASLPRPHYLGIDVSAGQDPSHIVTPPQDAKYPDVIAISFDDESQKMTCIYKDHSMYIWDVRDIKRVGKSKSFLYHSACIWGVDMYPEITEGSALPSGSFITCSSDDTVRVWNLSSNMDTSTAYKRNIYSNELLKVIYTDPEMTSLIDAENSSGSKTDKTDNNNEKNGVRCVRVSPDGQHLASGDRQGNIRVHDLQFMDQLVMLEAHNSEVLALEYTNKSYGVNLLATASRDRLIHVFDREQEYGLIQTLDDHSAAITAIKFTQQDQSLNMLSCGADKSLLFRNAQMDPHFQFVLNKHLVSKTTLYDMDVDPTQKFVATACQDRNIRIYNMKNGKQKKCYSGSIGTDGTVIRVQLDTSGSYVVTSCSDKNLCLLDFFTGEVLGSMFGHSEVVTGVKFMNDFKRVVSVSGDGCIFVWSLPIEMIEQAQSRQMELHENKHLTNGDLNKDPVATLNSINKSLDVPDTGGGLNQPQLDNNANIPEPEFKPDYSFSVGHLPSWAKKQVSQDPLTKSGVTMVNAQVPKGRWAQRMDTGITLKSVMDDSSINLTLAECMGEHSPKAKRDKRRFTVEPEALSNQLEQLSNLRRDTMVIANERKPSVPIITDDDENNVDEDDDDDFRATAEGETTSKNESRRNVFRGHTPLGYCTSSEPEDKDEDLQDTNVIYYPPNKEEVESPDAMSKSFQVFEGDNSIIKDHSSEGTDPISVEDISDEENESNIALSDTSKGFVTPDQEKFLKDHFESLAFKESFTNNLDDLAPDPTPIKNGLNDSFITNRLSISTRFLSRAQQLQLSKQALGHSTPNNTATQRKREEFSKAVDDTRKRLHALGWRGSNEKDSSSNCQQSEQDLPSPPTKDPDTPRGRQSQPGSGRRKPEAGSERRKTIGDVRQELTPSPIVVDIDITPGGTPTPERKRWSTDPNNIRKWQSMLDISDGRSSPARANMKSSAPPRSKTPLSYSMSSGGRTLPPTPTSGRYAHNGLGRKQRKYGWSKKACVLSSPSRKSLSRIPKSSSTKMEIRLDGTPTGGTQLKRSSSRSRSEKNLAETGEGGRRRTAKPSYMQQTSSSNAKFNKASSTLGLNKIVTDPPKQEAPLSLQSNKTTTKKVAAVRRGRLSSGAKSKFKSTPNLAELSVKDDDDDDLQVLDDMGRLRATEGSPEPIKSAFTSIKRNMPATKDTKNPFVTSSVPTDTKTEQTKSVWKRTAPDFKMEGDLEDENEGEMPENFPTSVKSRTQNYEDRLSMPPPLTADVPNSRLAKIAYGAKSSPTEITLDQAKDILLGKSGQKTETSSYTSFSNAKPHMEQFTENTNVKANNLDIKPQSSPTMYPSAPWRSVYSTNGPATTTGATTSPGSSALTKPSKPPGSGSDLDDTPVKDEPVSGRPRSRVEVSNIHLGAVSPVPKSQVNSMGLSSNIPNSGASTTTNVFMSPVPSPRRTEPPPRHGGPREGEPDDIPIRRTSSTGGATPVKGILKDTRSFQQAEMQLEEAEPGEITPEEGEGLSPVDRPSNLSLERSKATVLSRNRENLLNSLFSSGSKSISPKSQTETDVHTTSHANSSHKETTTVNAQSKPIPVQETKPAHASIVPHSSHMSPRTSTPRRRSSGSGQTSPSIPASTTKAQVDQAFKDHWHRKQQLSQQNIPLSNNSRQIDKQADIIDLTLKDKKDTDEVRSNGTVNSEKVQQTVKSSSSAVVTAEDIKSTQSNVSITSENIQNIQSSPSVVQSKTVGSSMDTTSTDSCSSNEGSPRLSTTVNRAGLNLPLHKVNKPDSNTPVTEESESLLTDLKTSLPKMLEIYAKLPDNHANKASIRAELHDMRDLLTDALGYAVKPCTGVTDTETTRFLQHYSSEMANNVWHLLQNKIHTLPPGSDETRN